MTAGGSGITPMYQLIQSACEYNDSVKIKLLYVNISFNYHYTSKDLSLMFNSIFKKVTLLFTTMFQKYKIKKFKKRGFNHQIKY